jgi:hypothetical protein
MDGLNSPADPSPACTDPTSLLGHREGAKMPIIMSSPFLYRNVPEPLGVLLAQAGAGSAPATLLIPDLQRPYVWKPGEIVVLVDSLLRGWPFGSLLVWNYGQDQSKAVEMPHRRFWREVDRTDGDGGTDVSSATLPATAPFRMILDGQQRVQSLLLAVGGDDWGLKLTDRQWAEALTSTAPRGRKVANPPWIRGQLCLNVKKYLAASVNDLPRQIDYVPLLEWVNTLAADGASPNGKASTRSVLPRMSDEPGEFVRLSRLWNLISCPQNHQRVEQLRLILPKCELQDILRLCDFVARLEAVKNTEVSLLVVQEKPVDITEDQYQDAIVNIFSRLNTQGRALSQEDITFAWIKAAWPSGHPVHGRVRQEFDALGEELGALGVTVTSDELVQAAALVWCVLDRADGAPGSVLAKKDLVNGAVMRAVVDRVASRWTSGDDGIRGAFVWIAERLHERGLDYGEQYLSYNALMTLWVWAAVADAWACTALAGTLDRDQFWKALRGVLERHVDRWLTVPSWAGAWSDGVERYTKELADIWKNLHDVTDASIALAAFDDFFASAFDTNTTKAAKDYIDRLDIDRRDRVRDYFVPLWFWTRLDADRWNLASRQLRAEHSRAKQTLHVDHVVPYSWWEKHPTGDEEEADGNSLGNCMLLHANFNLAKSATPAGPFLKANVTEFKNDASILDRWSKALLVSAELLDATAAGETSVRTAVAARTTEIRKELKEFIEGMRRRRDQ